MLIIRRNGAAKGEQSKAGQKHRDTDKASKEPFKMNMPKNSIKLTLKTPSGKPSNQTVLDKLGTSREDLESEKRKRKLEDPKSSESIKQRKLENQVTVLFKVVWIV